MPHTAPKNALFNDRPEDAVIDQIDALVDEQLAAGEQGDLWPLPFRDRCSRCGYEWHGLPEGRCPGPFSSASADELPNPSGAYSAVASVTLRDADLNPLTVPVSFYGVVTDPDAAYMQLSATFIPDVSEYEIIGPPTGFEILDRVMRASLAMLAEVCGIRLEDNDVGRDDAGPSRRRRAAAAAAWLFPHPRWRTPEGIHSGRYRSIANRDANGEAKCQPHLLQHTNRAKTAKRRGSPVAESWRRCRMGILRQVRDGKRY